MIKLKTDQALLIEFISGDKSASWMHNLIYWTTAILLEIK